MKSEGTHLIDFAIKLLINFKNAHVQAQIVKSLLSQEITELEKDLGCWDKMRDYRIDIIVDNNVVLTWGEYIQTRSILAYKDELMKVLVKDMNKDKKACPDAITNISLGISNLPCQLFDIEHKVLPNEIVKQEFLSIINQLVDDQFSLVSFDNLIEIQINLDDLA